MKNQKLLKEIKNNLEENKDLLEMSFTDLSVIRRKINDSELCDCEKFRLFELLIDLESLLDDIQGSNEYAFYNLEDILETKNNKGK